MTSLRYVPYVSSVTFLTLRALRWMETPLKLGADKCDCQQQSNLCKFESIFEQQFHILLFFYLSVRF